MDYQLTHPELSENMGYTPIERVFAIRGIKPQNINHYLNTTRDDILDPLLIENIDEGAKMFISHLARGSKIFV